MIGGKITFLNDVRCQNDIKRDTFPFFIVRLPYKRNDIPSNMFYSSIVAEVLRIRRTSFSAAVFLTRVKTLIQRMIKQGALAEELKKYS